MNFAISIGEIKEVTMTWIYSLNHRQEMKKEFWWGYFLESIHLENNKGDGRITLMDLREIGCEEVNLIELGPMAAFIVSSVDYVYSVARELHLGK